MNDRTEENAELWQTKLHARLHDPAEKALVLLRDPEGHEGGTSKALHRSLGFEKIPPSGDIEPDDPDSPHTRLFKKGVPVSIYRHVQRADWWAAAADRPQWPMEEIIVQGKDGETRTRKVCKWATVRWTKQPRLIHPLSGQEFDLGTLADTGIDDIKGRSCEHFARLRVSGDGGTDWFKTLLAYWRFGPELVEEEDDGKLGLLWPLLPADTRVPDHSIWDHLDLVSAFAGAFAADDNDEAALLALSLGPVQPFIAAARSTSDLWAGSHLLSRLSWEAMKVVCKRLGPDAILFPRLRGIPQVDVWLRDECGLERDWFKRCDWVKKSTDQNPLFSAALPNRFVAVVPASQAEDIAEQVKGDVRDWLQSQGKKVVDRLLEAAGLEQQGKTPAYAQVREQLDGFPEIHWACVPFSLIGVRDKQRQRGLDTTKLSQAMKPFFGAASDDCGFLASKAWKVLQQDIQCGSQSFWSPNPGVLYPAVYDLAERVLAAAKAVRPFGQTKQRGWHCSLTGESEWLTTDCKQLEKSYYKQQDTLWRKIARKKPAWAKDGEHLGALSAIKRLWPTIFAEEIAEAIGDTPDRFVVSTHTMALAHQLDKWLSESKGPGEKLKKELEQQENSFVALPARLFRREVYDGKLLKWARGFPALLDAVKEDGDETRRSRIERLIKQEKGFEHGIENYYALLMLDGDHMGRILSGDNEKTAIKYLESFHPRVKEGFGQQGEEHPAIKAYGDELRAISPNRHLAVSSALNDFALHVVPEVIEKEHLGRIIYAGGDDVLAMLPVADLLSVMQRLRLAYAGQALGDQEQELDWKKVRYSKKLVCKDGFAFLQGRLMRMMGNATASCGAVIAHHQAPLGFVLRELRETERQAKNEGQRDAFSLAVLKRSGGALRFTAKWSTDEWGDTVDLLKCLRGFLARPEVSRRAVYHVLSWTHDLPEAIDEEMLKSLLRYQFTPRQTSEESLLYQLYQLDLGKLVRFAVNQGNESGQWRERLTNFLSVAEFLAREVRSEPKPDDVAADAGSSPTKVAAGGV